MYNVSAYLFLFLAFYYIILRKTIFFIILRDFVLYEFMFTEVITLITHSNAIADPKIIIIVVYFKGSVYHIK